MKKFTTITAIILALTFIFQDAQTQNQGTTNTNKSSLTKANLQGADKPDYDDNAITIKLKEGVGDFSKQSGTVSFGIQSLDEKISRFEVYSLEKRFRYNPAKMKKGIPDLSRIYKITFPEKYAASNVIAEFASDPNLEYAELIPLYYADDIPNDALYNSCQHLQQIYAEGAWEIHHGEDGPEIIIAIIDDGTYWKHEDLAENIWQNLGEDFDNDGKTMEFIGGEWVFDPDDINNFDDDGNGFTDDFIGWDIVANNNDPDHNSGGDHGTHCAGIANGVTNNGLGIASIAWNVKTMPLQVSNPEGAMVGGMDGIIYAAENGADVISNSWGAYTYSQANQDVISYAQQLGSMVVAGASNDNSEQLFYPASYPGVISVASVNFDDTKTSYSNYGPAVDIAAPGGGNEGGILSTVPGNGYALMSGTSMATPLVAGCFGLLKSYHPEWSNEQLIIQMLGTADTINYINPGYENLLGTGRVNAFRFMDNVNVTMPQLLKLDLVSISYDDANGNQANEPGEEVILNFEFRNYVPFVGDDDVIVTLTTEDPEITILSGSATVDIPPDGLFTIEDQFQFLLSEEATPHMAVFTITFESELEITWGQENSVEVLVAPGGVFIFEGEENGRGYSGTYIKGVLDQLGVPYIYSNTYPANLIGFETVFVSHSNLGEYVEDGTIFTEEQSLMFQQFLESGGNMYVDMGSMFTLLTFYGYSNAAEMKSLFGVQSNTIHMVSNPMDYLYGMPGSAMEGLQFYQSNQPQSWFIDELVVASNAVATFTESNYGIVSVMNDGASTNGHKTFYLGYALAELVDIDPINSKNNVLLKVLDFFEMLPEDYVLAGFMANKHDGPQPLEVQFTDLSLSDPDYPVQSWEWDFDNDGIIDSQLQNPSWTFSDPGEYDITLIITNDITSDTLTKHAFITVNHGFLVYEGTPDGEGYSGTFIKNYMEENAFYGVTYRNEFPEDLEGYHAVFLSFGNFDTGNTQLKGDMADIIINYLEGGGKVYLEGGVAFTNQGLNQEFKWIFGIESIWYPAANPINYLEGQADALTADQVFTSTSQQGQAWINKYVPNESGIAAFVESDYGIVAVQNTGEEYNQRTFCFSYTLADLIDGQFPNTRAELLNRICNFFDIYVGENEEMASGMSYDQVKIYPNPVNNIATFSSAEITSFEIFDMMGALIARRNSNKVDMSNMHPGIYFVIVYNKNSNPLYKRKILKK